MTSKYPVTGESCETVISLRDLCSLSEISNLTFVLWTSYIYKQLYFDMWKYKLRKLSESKP